MAQTEEQTFRTDIPLTESALKAIIQAELDNALGVDGGKLSAERRQSLSQYLGEPYGNEVDGRSQVVDRTIMETVEWVLPALLRIFTAGDDMAEFAPIRPGDEQDAENASEYCNHIVMQDNPGFMLLYQWFKDALIQKVGYIKSYWDIDRTIENESYTGLTEAERDAILGDDDVELVEEVAYPEIGPIMGFVHQMENRAGEQTLGDQPLSPLFPSPVEGLLKDAPAGQSVPTLYDLKIKRTREEGRVRIEPVAPEEVLVSRRATSVASSPFVCHRTHKTLTELLEAGYDHDTVMQLSPFDEMEFNTERVQRFEPNDEWPYRSSRTDPPMVEVWVSECYIKVDWDNDGLAELRKITVAGDKAYTILDNEPVDEVPIIAICPIPMPHVLIGMSLADAVSDLQLIKTTLLRQMLDNLYLTNNPRTYVNEEAVTENTYDDLLTSRPGGIIRGKGSFGGNIAPVETPFVAAAAFPMMEYLDQRAEQRTGVARQNQGLAPDDLNRNAQIGSMGIAALQEAAAQRVELIARVFAETGVKELFKRVLGLVIRNQQQAREIRVTDNWIPMDPRRWKRDMPVTISVGLGTGNKDRIIGALNQVLMMQASAIDKQGGLQGPLVTLKQVYETSKKLVNALGFKDVDTFIQNPTNVPPQAMQPPQHGPNPHVVAAQASAQADVQGEMIRAQTQLRIAQLKAETDAQIRAMEAQADAQVRKYQTDVAAQVDLAKGLSAAMPHVPMPGPLP